MFLVITQTPIMFLDFTMDSGSKLTQAVPKDFNGFAYVLEGEGTFGKDKVTAAAHHILGKL